MNRSSWHVLLARGLIVLTLLALSASCGGGGDGGGDGGTDPAGPGGGEPQSPEAESPFRSLTDGTDLSVLILSPSAAHVYSSTEATIELAGMATGNPDTIAWSSSNGDGGTLPVASTWSTSVTLEPGDNQIFVTATEGAEESADMLFIIYDPHFGSARELELAPAGIFVGDTTQVTATLQLDVDADPWPDEVALFAWDPETKTTGAQITELFDRGGQGGDVLTADGIYTGQVDLTPTERGILLYRVRILHDLGETWSPPAILYVAEHMDPAAFEASLDVQQEALDTYDTARANGEDHDAAVTTALAVLKASPRVAYSGRGGPEGGIWAVYTAGFAGGLLLSPPGTRGGGGGTCSREPARSASFLNPFETAQFGPAEPAYLRDKFQALSCPDYAPVRHERDADVTPGQVRLGSTYGVMGIATHGDLWYDEFPASALGEPLIGAFGGIAGDGDVLASLYGLLPSAASPIFATGVSVTKEVFAGSGDDLVFGDKVLVQFSKSPNVLHYCLTPGWVYRNVRSKGGIVYVGSCRSAKSTKLAEAFLGRGAAAFIGYTEYVQSWFATYKAQEVFDGLLAKRTLNEAWLSRDEYDTRRPRGFPARMMIYPYGGIDDVRLSLEGFRNASFENDKNGWVSSEVQVVSRVGAVLPPAAECNEHMLALSDFSELSQRACVPSNATALRFRWNMVSDAFKEVCEELLHRRLQLTVTFGTHTILDVSNQDVCLEYDLTPVNAQFEDSPVDTDGTWQTGWLTQDFDVSSLGGQTLELSFRTEAGDNVARTLVLVDCVEFVYEE